MWSIPYGVIAASKPFRFLVGPDKKEFFMHAELIARMSEPLSAMVNGEWKERSEGVIELPETDEETFVRFCEFSYTGDYKAAEPPAPPKSEKEDGVPLPLLDSNYYPSKKKKKKAPDARIAHSEEWGAIQPCSPPPTLLPRRDSMWNEFTNNISGGLDESLKDSLSKSPSVSCSEVLLCHAHLYVFADCYAIIYLMRLSHRKLLRALGSFDLHSGGKLDQVRVADVVQLIDFLFRNTRSNDDIRDLLATYMACKLEDLWSNTYFRDVLESTGEVSRALIGQLMKRLN
ncbi:hypothetical protein F5Y02DRAFT_120111 [Annulohypoxylon stygium]|nr:hypothetical protein F5Y02DRAFT_120111 [Annulohypoxylon stygium]